jgi:hypothetical protein
VEALDRRQLGPLRPPRPSASTRARRCRVRIHCRRTGPRRPVCPGLARPGAMSGPSPGDLGLEPCLAPSGGLRYLPSS